MLFSVKFCTRWQSVWNDWNRWILFRIPFQITIVNKPDDPMSVYVWSKFIRFEGLVLIEVQINNRLYSTNEIFGNYRRCCFCFFIGEFFSVKFRFALLFSQCIRNAHFFTELIVFSEWVLNTINSKIHESKLEIFVQFTQSMWSCHTF